jgi:MoxR-like ATPase
VQLDLATAQTFGKQVRFQLLTPAVLETAEAAPPVDTLAFDRTLLAHWRPSSGSLRGWSLGNPTEGHYELVLDDQRRLFVLDRQRRQVPLILISATKTPTVVMAPWQATLDTLLVAVELQQQNLRQQRALFARHQPHLFIDRYWLQQVEESFFVLERDLAQLRIDLNEWGVRLPTLNS